MKQRDLGMIGLGFAIGLLVAPAFIVVAILAANTFS